GEGGGRRAAEAVLRSRVRLPPAARTQSRWKAVHARPGRLPRTGLPAPLADARPLHRWRVRRRRRLSVRLQPGAGGGPLRRAPHPLECVRDPAAGCAFSQDAVRVSLSAVFDMNPRVQNGTLQLCGPFSAALSPTRDVPPLLPPPAVPDECLPLNQVTALAERIMAPIQDVQVSASGA